jgi:hypothetical protein
MMSKEVINLTGRDIILIGERAVTLRSRERARVITQSQQKGTVKIEGVEIPLIEVITQDIVHLPDYKPGILYVVSGLVESVANRMDVYSPGRVLRDDNTGRAIGARVLTQRFR